MEEYLHPKFETMPREELKELQLKRLKKIGQKRIR